MDIWNIQTIEVNARNVIVMNPVTIMNALWLEPNVQQKLNVNPMEPLDIGKDKSPEVPFHRITSSYSYFEEFEFLHQFSKKQNMIKKKYQLNRTEKFIDKTHQFLHIKPKFKFAAQ